MTYSQVNPLAFVKATAPHISSKEEKRIIELSFLSDGLRKLEKIADWLVIEGAGGWFTPLTDKNTFADWVKIEKLPVILVIGIKLGCINHALLTEQAIKIAGLPFMGWIANNILPKKVLERKSYISTLRRMLSAPLLGCIPYLPFGKIDREKCSFYLNISALID